MQQWRDLPTSSWITTTAEYDHFGNKTSETDPMFHKTITKWNTISGRLPSEVINAAQQSTTFSPNIACSSRAGVVDPNGPLSRDEMDVRRPVPQAVRDAARRRHHVLLLPRLRQSIGAAGGRARRIRMGTR